MPVVSRFLKMMLISSLSSSLIINSALAATNISESSERVIRIANSINEEKLMPVDLVSRLQKLDAKRAKEIEAFISSNPNFKEIKLPKASVVKDKITFMFEGKKAIFSIDEKDGIDILVGKDQVRLEDTMTFEEMYKKISETLGEKHYSMMHFFISDAYASGIPLSLLIAAAVAIIFFKISVERDFVDSITKFQGACKRLKDTSSNEGVDIALLKESFNKLTDVNLEVCAHISHAAYNKKSCSSIPSIKQCFKAKIKQIENASINDSSRSQYKDNQQYDVIQDKFVEGRQR